MTSSCTWLLTWTTYGTWLPGDRRGFVSPTRSSNGERVLRNKVGEVPAADMPGLVRFAESAMRGARILLTLEQAGIVAFQFRETARHRQWEILSLAVMANHIHLVVSAPSSITTAKLIGDFKAYTTRQLNDKFGKRRWWTERGSGRRLGDESAIQRAVNYVFRQEHPLIVWAGNSQESECDPDGAL